MIEVLMKLGGEAVLLRVKGNDVQFANTLYGAFMAPIEGLKLSQAGTIKEFPELKDNPNWRIEAIAKFKDKIRDLQSEEKVSQYLIEDLRKWGYQPMWKQKAGFRKEPIK